VLRTSSGDTVTTDGYRAHILYGQQEGQTRLPLGEWVVNAEVYEHPRHNFYIGKITIAQFQREILAALETVGFSCFSKLLEDIHKAMTNYTETHERGARQTLRDELGIMYDALNNIDKQNVPVNVKSMFEDCPVDVWFNAKYLLEALILKEKEPEYQVEIILSGALDPIFIIFPRLGEVVVMPTRM
jgi:hypothetical protein